jgi:glycosyltransferase involved in cell wall biosynthesis
LFKKQILNNKEYEYVVFYNARNIRRKSVPDLIAGYKVFCDNIGPEKAKKSLLLLHTQVKDENGTDLEAVIEYLGDDHINIKIVDSVFSTEHMNWLYNLADVTCLVSSNEGWGLSLTESMMAGVMIIGNVTGGMQDQMRFVRDGKWMEFDEEFCSNHFGTYKECGEWVEPVFPSNRSLVGSIPTPYIWDDRCDFRDIAKAIENVYSLDKEERQRRGMLGAEWVRSEESMMTSEAMSNNMIKYIDECLSNFTPRPSMEFIKIEELKPKKLKHKLIY